MQQGGVQHPHIEPPAYPVIPAGATTANREELCTTNAAICKAWNTYKMVLTITCDQFAAVINDIYYAVLEDPTKGLNAVNLRTLIMHTSSIPMPRLANLIWMTT
jgi:hypothetical protein